MKDLYMPRKMSEKKIDFIISALIVAGIVAALIHWR